MVQKDKKVGYVYLAHAISTARYKIGCSENPERRLYELNKQSPYEIFYIKTFKVVNAHSVEKFLHSKYIDHKARYEWFEFGENQRDDVLQDMADFENISFRFTDNSNTNNKKIEDFENLPIPVKNWKKIYEVSNIFERNGAYSRKNLTAIDFAFIDYCRRNSIYKGVVDRNYVGYFNFLFQIDNQYIAIYLEYLNAISPSIIHNYFGQYLLAINIDKSNLDIQSHTLVFIASDIDSATIIKELIMKLIFSLPYYVSLLVGYFDNNILCCVFSSF